MSHLSAAELINQLQGNKSLTLFVEESNIIYKQSKLTNERRLSPWLGKRRYSKNYKFERRPSQQEQSQKTDEFLRKIFPHRRNKSMKMSSDEKQASFMETNSQLTKIEQKIAQSQESSLIYLPIKPINFEKLSPKITKRKEKDPPRQYSASKYVMHSIQPTMEISQDINSESLKQLCKPPPMNLTFKRYWRKTHRRSKTDPFDISNKEKAEVKIISIDEIYRLIGRKQNQQKQQKQWKTSYGSLSINKQQNSQHNNTLQNCSQQKVPWLVSRSLKNNRYIKNKALPYKVQKI